MDNMSDIGQVTFRPDTVRNLCHEARSPMPFFRDFRHLRILRESIARLWLIPIWHLFFGPVPVFPKLALSAGFNHRLVVAAWTAVFQAICQNWLASPQSRSLPTL